MATTIRIISAVIAILAAACTATEQLPTAPVIPSHLANARASSAGSYTDGVSLRAVAHSNNVFMAELYDYLKRSEPGNFIFSPLAVSTQLGMIKQGALGVTAKELEKTSLYTFTDPTILNGYLGLTRLYRVTPATKSTNNQVFLASDFLVGDVYRKTIETYFGGTFKRVLNMTKSSMEQIFDNMLANKYKGLLSVASMDQKLTLNTAGTFSSSWETPFDPTKTTMEPFYKSDGSVLALEMMKAVGDFEIADLANLDAKAISIPFADNQLNLVIVKPNKRTGFTDLERRLKEFSFHLIADKLLRAKLMPVSLSMPKLVIKSAHDLQEPLEMMGIKSLFSPVTANLTGMHLLDGVTLSGAIPLHVTDFVQSVHLYIDETGAYGANPESPPTPSSMSAMNFAHYMDPDYVTDFNANHPFMGYIHDWITDTVIYTFRKVE